MAPGSMVVEDGVEEKGPRTQTRPGWLLLLVGFGLGLGLGMLVTSPTATINSGDAVTEPADAAQSAADGGAGISALVPGFPDALVAVSNEPGGGLRYVLWPVAGPPIERSVTTGSGVRFDAGGEFLALSDAVPGLEGLLLSVGRVSGIQPVLSGVTSYAWHDSASGELAITTEADGVWALSRVSANRVPELVEGAEPVGGYVAAWGDWGFAVQIADGEIALLRADGRFVNLEPGRALASHPDGWVLIHDGHLELVSVGGRARRLEMPADFPQVSAAAFSPDRTMAAVAGGFGVVVVDLDDVDGPIDLDSYPSGWVSWSSDSRFVVAPARSGVLIHDMETGETHNVLVGMNVVAAGVDPLSSS